LLQLFVATREQPSAGSAVVVCQHVCFPCRVLLHGRRAPPLCFVVLSLLFWSVVGALLCTLLNPLAVRTVWGRWPSAGTQCLALPIAGEDAPAPTRPRMRRITIHAMVAWGYSRIAASRFFESDGGINPCVTSLCSIIAMGLLRCGRYSEACEQAVSPGASLSWEHTAASRRRMTRPAVGPSSTCMQQRMTSRQMAAGAALAALQCCRQCYCSAMPLAADRTSGHWRLGTCASDSKLS
jgi:hypothetical protein